MKSKIVVLGVAFLLLNAGYSIAEGRRVEPSETTVNQEKKGDQSAAKYCPVCGPENEMEGLSVSYKYKGKKYSFCSMDCLKAFKKEPGLYLNTEEPDKGHAEG